MVIYRAIAIDKSYINIVKFGIGSIAVICATIFVIAPNIFTDIQTAFQTFIGEARPNHLGADGLGFGGNLFYYARTAAESLGYLSVLPFAAGIAFIYKNRRKSFWTLATGAVYWLCLSALSLHWLRWGIPMFLFFNLVVGIGLAAIVSELPQIHISKKWMNLCCRAAAFLIPGSILINLMISGVSITKFSISKDTRLAAMDYCSENGITKENSLYEGYTPFDPGSAIQQVSSFTLTSDGVKVNENLMAKKYFVMSSSFKDRYLAEPDRYPQEAAVYKGLADSYELIYEISGDNYKQSPFILKNIYQSIQYLIRPISATGNTIYIYDLNKGGSYITIQPYLNPDIYLSADGENSNTWMIDGSIGEPVSLVSQTANLALGITEADANGEARLGLINITGEEAKLWTIIEEGDVFYITDGNNMALTYSEEGILIQELTYEDNQKWLLKPGN